MISRHACPRYFEILEDTLVGSRVFCFEKLQGPLDLIKHPKFYLFDNGVFNGLLNNFEPSLDRVGPLAEQLVYNQLMHSGWAAGEDLKISTLRTRQGNEVDFIVEIKGKIFAIEVKYSDHISMDDLEGLNFFNQIFPKNAGLLLFHMGQNEKKWGKIWSLPWQKGLQVMGL